MRRLLLEIKIWWLDGDIELMLYQAERIRNDLANALKERSRCLCELIDLGGEAAPMPDVTEGH